MEIKKTNTPWQASLSVLLFSKLNSAQKGIGATGRVLSLFFGITFCLFILSLPNLKAEAQALEGMTVDLRHPEFAEGILKTEQGGVISAEGIRIQAKKISYERRQDGSQAICKIEAEGDLLIEFNNYVFIGERLEYNFIEKTGVIFNGKTTVEPWFFGGEQILLNSDGSYTIYNSFLTTSENSEMEWKLSAEKATLFPNSDLCAKEFKFKYHNFPLFWLPSIKVNLDFIKDFPIKYSARWGGRQGPRIEFLYEIFSWRRWKTFARFDYRLTRGPGFGLESYYRSDDRKEVFESISYVARDSSLDSRKEKTRYRLQGSYSNSFFDNSVTLNLTYDKLSDKLMATDYSDSGLHLEYPGATGIKIRRQADNWIANLRSTIRLNTFQTIKQELPTFEVTWKPYTLGSSKVISNQVFRASYLDFQYADHIHQLNDFHSPRIQYLQQLYRTFRMNSLIITPKIGGTAIYYGSVPEENERWLILGAFKVDAKMPFYKKHDCFTHTLVPFASYNLFTMPTSKPKEHYIFDINDGLYELNLLQFGIEQSFYFKNNNLLINRPLNLSIFANAFFDSKTYHKTIPKIYGLAEFYLTPRIKYTASTAWDFEHGILDHFNLRAQWTCNANMALSAEYRHRSPYDFRKADRTNFFLDAYKSPHRLLDSPLSDRRDTILLDLFYRFHPLWAFGFQSRHGWNRKSQPVYNEFEIDLLGKPHAAWQVKFSYQHRENDHHRFTVYFNMGTIQPDCWKTEHLIPYAEF